MVAGSLILAVAGAAGAIARSADVRPTINLSAAPSPSTTSGDLPDLFIPTTQPTAPAPVRRTTPTSTPVVTMTTVLPSTTTTVADVASTTSTTSTSTESATGTASIVVVSHFPAVVRVDINDETARSWTLIEGQSFLPWTLITSNLHGDGASVTQPDTLCGNGASDDYFISGHAYLLDVVAGAPNGCGGNAPVPLLMIHDLTTGSIRQL